MNSKKTQLKHIFPITLSPLLKRILCWCMIGLNLLTGLFTIVSAYGGMVNPHVTAIPAILSLAMPLFLILSVGIIVADCFYRPKLALIPGISLLLCAGPIWAFAPLNFHSKPKDINPDSTFTMMTYNTMGLLDYRTVGIPSGLTPEQTHRAVDSDSLSCHTLSYIMEHHADVVAMQETPPRRVNYTSYINQSQIDSLNQLYPYHLEVNKEAEYLMSVFPIKPVAIRQPEDPNAWFFGGEINMHGTPVLFISLHLQSIGLSPNDKELYRNIAHVNSKSEIKAVKNQLLHKLSKAFRARAEQADMLASQIDSLGYKNVIIAGDFNDVPSCYAIRTLEKLGFRTVFSQIASGPTLTYHASRFYFQIDHILYRGDITPIAYSHGDVKLSDHYPVFATFALTPGE